MDAARVKVTKVALIRMVSMRMGSWFLSSFFGNYLTGYLGTFCDKTPEWEYFSMLMAIGLSAGAATLVVQIH